MLFTPVSLNHKQKQLWRVKGKRLKLVPRAFIHEEVRKAKIQQKRQRVRQKESQEQNIPRASQRKHIKWEWSTS